MSHINIPSHSVLLSKEKRIRAIQDLYSYLDKWKEEIDDYIHNYRSVYIGAGSAYTDVMVEANFHDRLQKGEAVSVAASTDYLWVILPQEYSPVVMMNGMEIPMTIDGTVTQDDVTYRILKSSNQYTETFNVILL